MKWLGKCFATLLLLLILAIIIVYFVAQTHWGAKQISQWINKQGHYQVNIESIGHSWLRPMTLMLNNVSVSDKQSSFSLNANTVDLDLKWQFLPKFTDLHKLTLQQGKLTLSGNQFPPVLKADILQLNQMDIQLTTLHSQIQGKNIIGGITPWIPDTNSPFGSGQYQFSASTISINELPFNKVVMQGSYQNNSLTISAFGAEFLKGFISGNGQQLPDGSWNWDNILINDIRWQSPMALAALAEKTHQLPTIRIKDLNLTNAKLQGKDWTVDYLDTTIKGLGLVNGRWQAEDGLIDFNAMNMTFNDAQLRDILGKLRFSGDIFTIANLTAHYQKGLFNIKAQWDRQSRQLTLNDSSVTGLIYFLPAEWRDYIKNPAPEWISALKLNNVSINNTLLIDANPDFPFQLTTLSGYIEAMDILKNDHWGLWNGQASLQAASGTFNKVEIARPYLQLHATDDKVVVDKMNAFTGDGLLQFNGVLEQSASQKPFQLNFKGMNVDLGILPQWGWRPLNVHGDGNFSLAITGDLSTDNIKQTISGTLAAEDKSSNKESQSIKQGVITTDSSPAGQSDANQSDEAGQSHTEQSQKTEQLQKDSENSSATEKART
ncbi:AsmA-like protein [Xenorhabdus cabanillasii]|uniref:AsmA-like protein n=1 Tax=Xenorhabdus cabanillasii TaxID=351673 RepID=A0A3D9UFJ0_9GAMM|nr:AsmA family protein [Xenorhabdus cabanillasii]REF26710.1 AsmA-like protein [Xenorhabdus cabanillasii]